MILLEDLREKVAAWTAAVAAARGVDVWDVSVKRGPRGWIVKVILDRPEGLVGVEDCAEVNVRLRARLELENALGGDFNLEVSSPGLDRRLRGPADFERFRGCLVWLKVAAGPRPAPVVGRLVRVEAQAVELDLEGEEGRRTFPLASIVEARLEPELPGFEKAGASRRRNRAAIRRKGRRSD